LEATVKRVLFAALFLLLAGSSVFLASPANATVNPEIPPITLPTCPGPTKTPQSYPVETTTTVKVEPCVEAEYASASTERVEVPVLDGPVEVKGLDEVISLLRWVLVMNVLTLMALIIRRWQSCPPARN